MIALDSETYRHHREFDDSAAFERFERITYRRHREFPVRSQASRTRGKMRARGGVAARHKAAAYNGVNRRGRGKLWA